jgi:2-polyprenyl-3-methyl-5-hydroxy-6-metoxy-1,4-benzoquinol methylase
MAIDTVAIDEARIEAFVDRVIDEIGAALNVPLTVIGERLGLYRAMADGAPVRSAQLAERTQTHERYVREWLAAQAAGGYVEHDPDGDTYRLPLEHAAVLADESSPIYQLGLFQSASAAIRAQDPVADRFRTGDGLGWHEHHDDLFHGTAGVFGLAYVAHLVQEWIPALDGVEDKLKRGARVADVGAGLGVATVLLAQAYPNSTFVGFDAHLESIQAARASAAEAGVEDRVRFELASATNFHGTGYDLIACFDSLHDMGDPAAAAAHIRSALAPDGTLMVVEPQAGDAVAENLHPLGRINYGFSTLVCTPGSLSQEGRAGLGTLAGEARLAEAIRAGGFGHVRRAAETDLNMVLEARI